jgi:hypothetical protein
MSIFALDTIKTHLRLPLTADAELDAELQRMELAAIDYATQYLNRDSIPWMDTDGVTPLPVPDSVQHGILLIIGDFYANREGQITDGSYTPNPMVENLLHFYRIGLGI